MDPERRVDGCWCWCCCCCCVWCWCWSCGFGGCHRSPSSSSSLSSLLSTSSTSLLAHSLCLLSPSSAILVLPTPFPETVETVDPEVEVEVNESSQISSLSIASRIRSCVVSIRCRRAGYRFANIWIRLQTAEAGWSAEDRLELRGQSAVDSTVSTGVMLLRRDRETEME